jgi:hypothetical protein
VRAIVAIWSPWLFRNDKVSKNKNSSLMHVIYQCMALHCLWSSLQRLEDREFFTEVSKRLENSTKKLFPNMDGCIIVGLPSMD